MKSAAPSNLFWQLSIALAVVTVVILVKNAIEPEASTHFLQLVWLLLATLSCFSASTHGKFRLLCHSLFWTALTVILASAHSIDFYPLVGVFAAGLAFAFFPQGKTSPTAAAAN